MKKRGNILVENIIFIVLTLLFFTILSLFVVSKMGSAAVLEEKYAKQIALLIDSAKLGMIISITMEDALEKTEKENFDFSKVVLIQDNIVNVKLREGAGYSYSFFNNVELDNVYQDGNKYVFIIGEKIKNEDVEK